MAITEGPFQNSEKMDKKLDAILKKLDTLPVIQKTIEDIKSDLSKIKADVSAHDTRIGDIENSVEILDHDLDAVKTDTTAMMKQVETIKENQHIIKATPKGYEDLQNRVSKLEIETKRCNLIIDGLEESEDEVLNEKVIDVLKDKLEITNISPTHCHRINKGRPGFSRPVHITFANYGDREKIWDERRKLKGTNIFLREDLTPYIESRRRAILPLLQVAKQKDKKSYIFRDILIYKGKSYTIENIPSELFTAGEAGICAKKWQSSIYFNGRTSPFSNFFASKFSIDEKQFHSVEQYYTYSKAIYCQDFETASWILSSKDPLQCK